MSELVTAALIGAALLLAKKPAKPKDEDLMPMSERRRRFRCAVEVAKLGDGWMRFLETTAMRESRFSVKAWNDSPGETKASQRAVNKRRQTLLAIGLRPNEWAYGSKGLFQFLGPYVALKGGELRFPLVITNPEMAFDPGISVAAALSFARGLTKWNNFPGTWAGLRVGWGMPGNMGKADELEKKGAAMEARAQKLGWPPGWVNNPVDPIPKYDRAQLTAIAGAAKVAYEGCI